MRPTVCLPTYNEIENLERMVRTLGDVLPEGGRVLVIDDGSPDGTGELADRLAEELPWVPSSTASARKGSGAPTSPGSTARSPTAPSSSSRWTATSPTTRATSRG